MKKLETTFNKELKQKNTLITIGLIIWMILGLILSLPIAIYYGFRIFQNRQSKYSGRYLNQYSNKHTITKNYSLHRRIFILIITTPLVLMLLPILTIFCYVSIIGAIFK